MNAKTDFWPFLRATATGADASGTTGTGGELHFVRAGKNTAWADTPGVLAGFDELGGMETEAKADAGGAAGRVQLHTLPGVGHWVHIEAAGRVFGILNEAFVRADAAANGSLF
jgi:pimeloyl-ACP methyl ester carboxylesterase